MDWRHRHTRPDRGGKLQMLQRRVLQTARQLFREAGSGALPAQFLRGVWMQAQSRPKFVTL